MALGWLVTSRPDESGVVLSARRGPDELPAQAELLARTQETVAELLAAGGTPDTVGWFVRNISAALMTASREITSWEGLEWAVESGDDDEPPVWAEPEDGRTPYSWLRAWGAPADTLVDIYQDGDAFGLSFLPFRDWQLPATGDEVTRPRRGIPLVTGRVERVDLLVDTGVVTEVRICGATATTLLIAAEPVDSRDDWRRFDESVTALPDPARADTLEWIPPRRPWR